MNNLLAFTRYTTCDATQYHHAGPLTPRHKGAVCGDDELMIDTPYVDTHSLRDSARKPLLTAVRNRRSGLALHPRRGTTRGLAAPDWRGGIRVEGRTVSSTQ